MNARPPVVAIVYNEPVLPVDHPDQISEADVVQVAEAVLEGLTAEGFAPLLVPAAPPVEGLLHRLRSVAPNVVFNLMEGFGGQSGAENHITALFELLGLPYTGSDAATLGLCLSKARTKTFLRGAELPTAPALLIGPGDAIRPPDFPGPYLVKPDAEDGSLGVDQSSVVTEPDSLGSRVERLRRLYRGSVLIEAYLPGPEFNVGVLALPEPEALPISQIVYAPDSGFWPILTYVAKWDVDSAEDKASRVACPAPIEPGLASELAALARRAVALLGCRDYTRVDFRLDGSGRPMILEVNPNPDISPTAGFARALGVSGRSYSGTLAAIVRAALARRSGRPGAA